MSITILVGTKYKDNSGETIYFKQPYFDQGLRRKFNSAEEKHQFMKAHNIISTGESDYDANRRNKKILEEIAENKLKEKRNGKA